MFTGIVTDIGTLLEVRPPTAGRPQDMWAQIETRFDMATIALGASICCSGVCLTVVETGGARAGWFAVEISGETLSKTTLGAWRAGMPVNLERSLKVGDELGGHFVFGHVDGVAEVVSREPDGGSERWVFAAPRDVMPFIAAKGSIALDGVSLTVNSVDGATFGVNLIAHTRAETTFGTRTVGDRVNLEVDMLARYVRRAAGLA